MTEEWTRRPYTLTFWFGELRLFAVTLRSATRAGNPLARLGEARPAEPDFPTVPPDVDVLVLRSEPIAAHLPPVTVRDGTLRYVPAQFERYFADLRGTFASYLGTFSPKSRSTLQRKVRKAAEILGGEVSWREYRKPDEMREFHRLARMVSATTYQERRLDAGLPGEDAFLCRMDELARAEQVRGYLLFADKRPVAYQYCPVVDGALVYQYVGYDPEFQRASPGTVLQYLVLEHLFAEQRIRYFDFTEGEGAHKEFFATGSVRCANILYFQATWRSRGLVALHRGVDRNAAAVARLLERWGLKGQLKKLFRGTR